LARRADPSVRGAARHPADPDRRTCDRSRQKPIDFCTFIRAKAQDRAHRIVEDARAKDEFDKTAGDEGARVREFEPGLFACGDRAPIDDLDIALRH
jgi:hypothetical protein